MGEDVKSLKSRLFIYLISSRLIIAKTSATFGVREHLNDAGVWK